MTAPGKGREAADIRASMCALLDRLFEFNSDQARDKLGHFNAPAWQRERHRLIALECQRVMREQYPELYAQTYASRVDLSAISRTAGGRKEGT